ncbi:hypothetical protein PBI_PBS1_233 [Bacillus phage PBS1]|uniref:Uncharacterized protein n=1 Tax=Bacillus phage PBS1 TaxID=2884423 RepID=A0A223LDE6_BPPB1|nr:hypothetical protein FK780_gp214 [Bacillus phage PBS1]ASU00055.1 hypothetical protein PBI_PBS1_233 [Bacillus phage PBS1]
MVTFKIINGGLSWEGLVILIRVRRINVIIYSGATHRLLKLHKMKNIMYPRDPINRLL